MIRYEFNDTKIVYLLDYSLHTDKEFVDIDIYEYSGLPREPDHSFVSGFGIHNIYYEEGISYNLHLPHEDDSDDESDWEDKQVNSIIQA